MKVLRRKRGIKGGVEGDKMEGGRGEREDGEREGGREGDHVGHREGLGGLCLEAGAV